MGRGGGRGGSREGSSVRGACSEGGWQAHSVRRESCNTDSSPEPSAACSEGGVFRVGGVWGEGAFDLRVRRWVLVAR